MNEILDNLKDKNSERVRFICYIRTLVCLFIFNIFPILFGYYPLSFFDALAIGYLIPYIYFIYLNYKGTFV